jgi:hypothetical protein
MFFTFQGFDLSELAAHFGVRRSAGRRLERGRDRMGGRYRQACP